MATTDAQVTAVAGADRSGHGDAASCSLADSALAAAFGLLGKRWNGMLIGALSAGESSFSELRRTIGTITDSMLSDRLSELTTAGLVERTVTDSRPPGVSYRLTPAGTALLPILQNLAGWAADHLPERCAEAAPPPP